VFLERGGHKTAPFSFEGKRTHPVLRLAGE
jgi:hypothetical protein